MRELIERLDQILVDGPRDVKEMELREREIEEVMVCVRKYVSGLEGRHFDAEVVDVIGAPGESSSIVTIERYIANKILPYLRSHLQKNNPGFKVTDLVAFGKPNFVRLHESHAVECNMKVGKTSAIKRGVLSNWTILLRAIREAVHDAVDTLGEEKTKLETF